MSRDSLETLVRLIALTKDPHQLIVLAASDESMLHEAKRAYHEQKKGLGINPAVALCGSYKIPLAYFQDRLRLIVHLLNLVPPEEDYYRVLGVKATADHDQIKRSFRRLSRVHHPDINPGDPQAGERFRKLREAYEVLSNSTLRERYDLHAARSPRIEEGTPPEKVPRAEWRYRRHLRQFGVLVIVLGIASLLIDYQDLITRRYYQAKYRQVPESSQENTPPSRPEMTLAQAPPETPVPVPGPVPVAVAPEISLAQVPPEKLAAVPDDAEQSKGREISDKPQPGLASGGKKPAAQTVREVPIKVEATPAPQKTAAAPAKSAPLQVKPAMVRPASQTPPTPGSLPPTREQTRAPVVQAAPGPNSSKGGPEGLETKPAKAVAAKAADGVVAAADMNQHLQDFLNRYARAYEDKNSTLFFSLFEPGAVENGEPVASILPRYRDNFQRLEKIRYSIRLVQWEGSEKDLKVNGSFRLQIKLRGEEPRVETGTMQFDLIHRGDDFRINRLAYHYNPSQHE